MIEMLISLLLICVVAVVWITIEDRHSKKTH